jgi:hypothetical protein
MLRVKDGHVLANYDYDDESEPGEALPLDDFVGLLEEWRARVILSASESRSPLPETYRRNPLDSKPRHT